MSGGKLQLGHYNINMLDKLGQGGFGVVYRGKHRRTGQKIAAKQCNLESDSAGSTAMAEIKNFQVLQRHPHVVKLLDFHYKDQAFWMILEFCDEGDLNTYFRSKRPGIDEQLNLMYQAASAIEFMHEQRNVVVHRDVKPDNIMVKRVKGQAIVKVTDFGLSKIVDMPDPAKTLMFSTLAGTPGYMAPEFFLKERYTKSVDVFALGLVFLAMVCHEPGAKCLMPPVVEGLVMTVPVVGMQMVMIHQMKQPMPEFVKIAPGERGKAADIKALVRKMIPFESRKRCSMTDVVRAVKALGGSSPFPIPDARVPGDALPPADTAGDDAGSGGDDDDGDSSGSSDAEVGYRVMMRALHEALRERLAMDSDAAGLVGGMRFRDMLAEAVRDDPAVNDFKPGDKVIVEDDQKKAEELQAGYGGWVKTMAKYLGGEGIVKAKEGHMVAVIHDDKRVIRYNPKLLRKTGATLQRDTERAKKRREANEKYVKEMKEKFKRFDVVHVPSHLTVDDVTCLQKGHGGWNPKMEWAIGVKGMVNRVDDDGDVYVEFINGDGWTLNPEVLIHIDMSGLEIEAGDYVVTGPDEELAKELQQETGLWKKEMEGLVGHSGIVRNVKDAITVESGKTSFPWHPSCVQLVAKGEEMMEAILRKNLQLHIH